MRDAVSNVNDSIERLENERQELIEKKQERKKENEDHIEEVRNQWGYGGKRYDVGFLSGDIPDTLQNRIETKTRQISRLKRYVSEHWRIATLQFYNSLVEVDVFDVQRKSLEKMDEYLQKKGENINEKVDDVKDDVDDLEADLREEIREFKNEMREDRNQFKTAMRQDFNDLRRTDVQVLRKNTEVLDKIVDVEELEEQVAKLEDSSPSQESSVEDPSKKSGDLEGTPVGTGEDDDEDKDPEEPESDESDEDRDFEFRGKNLDEKKKEVDRMRNVLGSDTIDGMTKQAIVDSVDVSYPAVFGKEKGFIPQLREEYDDEFDEFRS